MSIAQRMPATSATVSGGAFRLDRPRICVAVAGQTEAIKQLLFKSKRAYQLIIEIFPGKIQRIIATTSRLAI
jgi:hypothetical protein